MPPIPVRACCFNSSPFWYDHTIIQIPSVTIVSRITRPAERGLPTAPEAGATAYGDVAGTNAPGGGGGGGDDIAGVEAGGWAGCPADGPGGGGGGGMSLISGS